jgi:ABC-type uncharacterized transport system substrate-binding protein
MMRRRDFILALGGAAAWPVVAHAQQQQMTPTVGFLGPALDRRQHWLAAFRTGLGAEGFVDGQNVKIDYRSADSGGKELPELAADLVRREVAVIAASGPPAALAAQRATPNIPIVFVSGADPVQMGLVSSRICRFLALPSRSIDFGSTAVFGGNPDIEPAPPDD